ncbi:monocarboxylate transporter 12-B-like isoform X2 [Gouania willdenowi]|uniref:Major facilitator superfamily (MFS) profile domain-containing protein n=1 Tax=Gouania willdenowi TaxID=441366 RepID=A0A8C5GCR8_GOUWI|nr:monocarboxylate transporter 12 isoform X2 [Gouania willdenowi]
MIEDQRPASGDTGSRTRTKTKTRTRTKTSTSTRTSMAKCPPDGGWGWVIVGCCFMVTVCTRAVTRCFSIFFVEFQTHFEADYAATAWIHSLVDCTTMLCAPLGSLLMSRWSCRLSVIVGGLLSSCGLLISSLSSSLELLYFSMGILTGLGFALCYTPSIALVGLYFRRKKALAYGVAMSGSGIGTFVLAPAVQLLIDLYSWRGALLVLSAFVGNLCVCGALLRPVTLQEDTEEEEEPTENKQYCDNNWKDPELAEKPSSQSKDTWGKTSLLAPPHPEQTVSAPHWSSEYRFLLKKDFLSLSLSFLFLAGGCSLPFVYLVPFALSVGVGPQSAAFLMSILGVIDIVGNITFGWLTDRPCLKPWRLGCYIISILMEGLCCLVVPLLHSFALLVPFAILYGYFDGAYVALIPVVTSDVVGVESLTAALGLVYFLHSVPYLLSPPIGGWLVDVTGSYTPTFLLSGTSMLLSASILVIAAGIHRCRHKPRPLKTINEN